ncbi:MAG TPA: alpha/beta fold hydrolase [Verrucomicrobiae bacterium]|jgi:pimeloyl-ACP methyl ester carboxylesterase|nr:alpha/beta fold hydrolase [Verrucomicrobiae bacterium]
MQLNFRQLGQGRPLVMLHGLFGSLDNWLGVAPKLAETFNVFLVDMRNHGLSPHDPEMNYSVMAEDVAEFFDSQKLDRANILGHSMGGKAAMQFALNFPGRVEKLVVVDIAPRAFPPDHNKMFKALLALDLPQFQSRRQMEEVLAPDIPDLVIRQFLLKNLKSPSSTASSHFEWRIPLDLLFKNYPNICAAIPPHAPFPGPALFLRGGKSHYLAENALPQLCELFPQAKLETIEQAGHWVHADAREEFLQRTLRFLTED